SRERVALEDALQHVLRGRRLRVEAIGGVARVEDDGVAGLDLEARRERVVPLVVDGLRVEGVGFHGGKGSTRVRVSGGGGRAWSGGDPASTGPRRSARRRWCT